MMEGMVCVLCLQSDVGFAIDEGTKSAEKGETWRGGGKSTKSGIGNARLSVHGLQRAMSVAFLAGLSSA